MRLFIDTETTGFASGGVQPRIVSIAWMIAAEPNKPRVFKAAIVRPEGFDIPAPAQAVHGISTEKARKEGLPLKAVLADLHVDIATLRPSSIVAHNLAYDRPIINAEYSRLGMRSAIDHLDGACTMLAARKRWPGNSAKLIDVYQRVFSAQMKNAHNASGDVWACHQVFFSLQR